MEAGEGDAAMQVRAPRRRAWRRVVVVVGRRKEEARRGRRKREKRRVGAVGGMVVASVCGGPAKLMMVGWRSSKRQLERSRDLLWDVMGMRERQH